MQSDTNPLPRSCRYLLTLFIVITVMLLVACKASEPPDPPQAATSTTPAASPQVTNTPQPTHTAMATASRTPRATETLPPAMPTPLPTVTREPQIYEVRVGDSLTYIADRFATTSAAIQIANELFDANAIVVGMELIIPFAAPAGRVSPAGANRDILKYSAEFAATAGATQSSSTPAPRNNSQDDLLPYDRAVLHNRFLCPAKLEPVPKGAALVGRLAVCRLPIVSYRLGQGETPLILVGGVHGGYEWNTILLAEEMRDYLLANPEAVPPSLTIYLIPNANPDGLYAVTGQVGTFEPPQDFEETVPGRFNGRYVDLNRNWDCDWAPTATWGEDPVSGGAAPFSEPETEALRDYFLEIDPAAVLLWHSAAVGVYPSGCREIDPQSAALAEVFGQAAGYHVHDSFYHYDISGDAGNWLTSIGIPAITVELSTHNALDWQENLAGLQALLEHFAAEAAETAE